MNPREQWHRSEKRSYLLAECGQLVQVFVERATPEFEVEHVRAHFPVGEAGEFTWFEMDGREGPKVGT